METTIYTHKIYSSLIVINTEHTSYLTKRLLHQEYTIIDEEAKNPVMRILCDISEPRSAIFPFVYVLYLVAYGTSKPKQDL